MEFSMEDFLVNFEEEINEIFENIEDIEEEKVNRDLIISVVSEVLKEEQIETNEYEVLGLIERVASNRYSVKQKVRNFGKETLKENLRKHINIISR